MFVEMWLMDVSRKPLDIARKPLPGPWSKDFNLYRPLGEAEGGGPHCDADRGHFWEPKVK